MSQLVAETDPDITSRLAMLEAERARIDEQIEQLSAGDFEVLDTKRATERVDEILNLVTEVPSDFARVREDIERLNHDLREKLIDSEDSRSLVLQDIFRGVDILANSDAGRSFYGFYQLLLDPERGLEFEQAVRTITERDFATQLAPAHPRALRRMLPLLQDRSAEVRQVLTSFSRSLRRFVQTQRLTEERLLNAELRAGLIRAEPERWRIRILDDRLWISRLSDITAPVDQLATLDLAAQNVLIVENLISLLTLPAMPQTVAVFGKGTAVTGLARVPWIHTANVYYWGDLDTHGFRILHSLRVAGIVTGSLLMDLPTLEAFADLWVTESKPFQGELEFLTLKERAAFDCLREHRGTRLEQECIDWAYVLDTLDAHGLRPDRLD